MNAAPNFNLTIIYESVEEGKRAKRFSDQFIAETPVDRPVKLHLWNFGVLGIPEVRNVAASTAAVADVVILSMSGTVPLPAHAVEWIEMWIWLIDGRRPAVVALFADHHRQGAAIRAYLKRNVVSKKLDFFPVMPGGGTFLARQPKEGARAAGQQESRAVLSVSEPRFPTNGSSDPLMEQPRG